MTSAAHRPSARLRGRDQAGFTLLEVMVATAILAAGLSAVVGGIGMTVRSTALATGYERARVVAETQLAEFVAQRPERAGSEDGDTGGVRWRVVAERDDDNASLLRVTVETRFFAAGGERVLTLETREMLRTLAPEGEVESGAGATAARQS